MIPDLSLDQQAGLQLIVDALAHRLAEMGEVDGGLYQYYRRKLDAGVIVAECDREAIGFFRGQRDRWPRIWEIGAGIGQLGAMLALDGFRVVSVDHDRKRFSAMQAIKDSLVDRFPLLAERWQLRYAAFPAAVADDDVSRDVALAIGCAFTQTEDYYEGFRVGLARFDAAVVDFGSLFTEVKREGDEDGRAEAFCSAFGLPPAKPIFRHTADYRPGRWTAFLVEHGRS